jgi:phenylalanyl-tRNA synthetase alpha subunit
MCRSVMRAGQLLRSRLLFARNFSPGRVTLSTTRNERDLQELLGSKHPLNNVPSAIESKIGRNLHLMANHPLNIIKNKIEKYCNDYAAANNQSKFTIYDKESPVADTKNCFDDLLVPPDHCSRSRSDTYYLTDKLVYRL